MPIPDSKWGEDDPEYTGEDDPEIEEELFKTSKEMGMTPEDMMDEGFAVRYKDWLKKQG